MHLRCGGMSMVSLYYNNYIYYYICLTAFFHDNLSKPAPER